MEQPHHFIFRPSWEEGRRQRVGLGRHDTDFDDKHDDQARERPLPGIPRFFPESEDVSHHAPGKVENAQFHEKLTFIEAFVGGDPLGSEFVVNFAEFHVHEDVVCLFHRVEFVGCVGGFVFIGMERQG